MPDQGPREELWQLVLPYLQKPIPLPLSNPRRSALHQSDLASTSRVCKLFYTLSYPLLWTHICTDQLHLHLRDENLTSPRRPLSLTRSLLIEYSPSLQNVSYEDIVGDGGNKWAMCALTEGDKERKMVKRCEREIKNLRAALEWVPRDEQMVKKVLPSLEKVAIASIYGKEDNRWRVHDTYIRRNFSKVMPLQECKGWFDQFLHNLPKIKHLCVRNPNGAFTVPQSTFASHVPLVTYSRTVHYPSDVDEVYLPYGAPITWTSDARPDEDSQKVVVNMSVAIEKNIMTRKDGLLWDRRGQAATDGANVDLYCSTAHGDEQVLDDAAIERILETSPHFAPHFEALPKPITLPARTIGREEVMKSLSDQNLVLTNALRQHSDVEDSIRWKPSWEMPICSAWGSGPPVAKEGGE